MDPGDGPAPTPAQGGVKARAKGAAGRIARPVTFRFAQLQERADHTEALTTTAVQRTEELQNGLWGLATRVDEIGGRLEMVFDQLDADMQVMGEFARITERLTRRLGAHADDVAAAAARVERRAGSDPTEQPVLLPFVFAALADLEPGSRVLVYDEAATPVALALASTGHRVSVVDARPYPYAHPGLEVLGGGAEPGSGPEPGETFAAVVCIRPATTGADGAAPDLPAVVGRLAPHVAPGGRLVVSAGADAGALGPLLTGWTVLDRRGYRCDAAGTWSPAGDSETPDLTVVSARPA